MRDVTVVIITYDRPTALKGCLRSVRGLYPDIPILVSDNGDRAENFKLCRKFGARHLKLPFDCGANMARKMGQQEVETKYWVIGEDDFIYTKDTKLENFKLVLDHDRKIDLVGGPCIRNNNIGTVGSTFRIEAGYEAFYRTPIRKPVYNVIRGIPYFYCDYVRMFFMARKETPIDWEEKLYTGSGTHISIFLKNYLRIIKNEQPYFRSAFTYSVAVSHPQVVESKDYRDKRKRVRSQWSKLFKETGLRYGVFDNKRVRDFKLNKNISYEEFLEIRTKREEAKK